MVDRNSPEYRTLIEYNDVVTSEIRADLVSVVQALHRNGIVPQAVVEETQEVIGVQSRSKAASLVNHICDKVQVNPKHFETFCTILDELNHQDVARKLRENRNKLTSS